MAEYRATYVALADFSKLDREVTKTQAKLAALEKQGNKTKTEMVDGHEEMGGAAEDHEKSVKSLDDAYHKWGETLRLRMKDVDAISKRERKETEILAQLERANLRLKDAQAKYVAVLKDEGEESDKTRLARLNLADASWNLLDVEKQYSVHQKETKHDNDLITESLHKLSAAMDKAKARMKGFGMYLKLLIAPAILSGVRALVGLIMAAGAGIVELVPALFQASSILAALPQLAMAVAQAFGAVAISIMGIGGALKEVISAQEQALEKQAEQAYMAKLGVKELNEQQQQALKIQLAMDKLAPAAQTFVKLVAKAKEPFQDLAKSVQQKLFPAVNSVFKDVVDKYFPFLEKGLGSMATVIGGFVRDLGALITGKGFMQDLGTAFKQNLTVVDALGKGIINIIDTLRHIGVAAKPVVDWISEITVKYTEMWRASAQVGRETGTMTSFFEKAIDAAQILGHWISGAVDVLYQLGRAASEVGLDAWSGMADGMHRVADEMETIEGQTKLKAWFEDMKPVLSETWKLFKAVGKAMVDVGDGGKGMIKSLQLMRTELLPALERLFNAVDGKFLPALIELLAYLLDIFAELVKVGGALTIFLEAIKLVAKALSELLDLPFVGTIIGWAFALNGLVKVFGALQVVAIFLKTKILTSFFEPFMYGLFRAQYALKAFTASMAASKGVALSMKAGLGAAFAGMSISTLGIAAAIAAVAAGVVVLAKLWKETAAANAEAAASTSRAIVLSVTETSKEFSEAGSEAGYFYADALSDALVAAGADFQDEDTWVDVLKAQREAAIAGETSIESYGKQLEETIKLMQSSGVNPDVITGMFAGGSIESEQTEIEQAHNAYVQSFAAINEAHQITGEGLKDLTALTGSSAEEMADHIAGMMVVSRETGGYTAKSLEEAQNALQGYADAAAKSLQTMYNDMQENFSGMDEVISDFSGTTTVNSEKVNRSLERTNAQYERWYKLIKWAYRTAGEDGEAFVDSLQAQGIDSMGVLKGLKQGHEKTFTGKGGIVENFNKGEEAATDFADEMIVGFQESMQIVVDSIREALGLKPVVIDFSVDTQEATNDLKSWMMTLPPGVKLATLNKTVDTGGARKHSGGWIGRGEGPDRGVPIRAQQGEYIVRAKEAKRHATLLESINAGEVPVYHKGGFIEFSAPSRRQTKGMEEEAEKPKRTWLAMHQLQVNAELATPSFQADIPTSAGGGGTPAANIFTAWAKQTFDGLTGAPSVEGTGRTIGSTGTISQHAYGNAVDLFGSASVMASLFAMAIKLANALKLAHAIYAMKAWSYNNRTVHPYDVPPGGDPHYSHVHADFLPQYPLGKREGGIIGGRYGDDQLITAQTGEFIFNRSATRKVGALNLSALNASASQGATGSALVVHDVRDNISMFGNAEGVGTVQLALEVDGETLTRSVDLNHEMNRIKMGGRA